MLHIGIMLTTGANRQKAARPRKTGVVYRGVRLQAIAGRSRFPLDQLEQAVKAAIEKNADALAGKAQG